MARRERWELLGLHPELRNCLPRRPPRWLCLVEVNVVRPQLCLRALNVDLLLYDSDTASMEQGRVRLELVSTTTRRIVVRSSPMNICGRFV
jgi:hypothetical protein